MLLPGEKFAYDLDNDIISKGENFNTETINQSILNILLTSLGSRLFNPLFGSSLADVLFNNFSDAQGEQLAENLITQIEFWDDRVLINKENSSFEFDEDNNTLNIKLIYSIRNIGIIGEFSKLISF